MNTIPVTIGSGKDNDADVHCYLLLIEAVGQVRMGVREKTITKWGRAKENIHYFSKIS
jgi:hypothetical protein